ncbi:hypothetical protein [Oceanobacillus damuensis]|uniref:hypothetical protein n=1 Tax=Oceanobacillus damuensis TaxID=937928 RepID=UPI00082C04A7|nr:hypothetical protein [Oceanobacillus damuensis]
MEKIIDGHLVGFGSVNYMERLEADYYAWFTNAGMSEVQVSRYSGVPCKDECDRICAELSEEVHSYKIKKPRN